MRYYFFVVALLGAACGLTALKDHVIHMIRSHGRESHPRAWAQPPLTPLSPALQDTAFDTSEIADAWAILERRGSSYTRDQVELYLFMRDAYVSTVECP